MTQHMTFGQLFLEDPTPLLLGLVLITLVLWILAKRRGDRRLGRGAMVAAGIGILIFLLAWFVETTREHLMDRTRFAVQATAPLNMTAIRSVMSPQVELVGPSGATWISNGRLLDYVETAVGRMPIEEHDVLAINAREDAPGEATSGIKVRTRAAAFGGLPVQTHWEFRWEKDAAGRWRIVQVRFVEFQGRQPARNMLP